MARADIGQVRPDANRAEHRRLGKQVILRDRTAPAPAPALRIAVFILHEVLPAEPHLHIHRGTGGREEVAGLGGIRRVEAGLDGFPLPNRQAKRRPAGRPAAGCPVKATHRLLCGRMVFLARHRLDVQFHTLVGHLLRVAGDAAAGLVDFLAVARLAKQGHGIAKLVSLLVLGAGKLQAAQLVIGSEHHRRE